MGFEDWAWILDRYGFEFERSSRWHPRHEGRGRSPDRIGDHLIHRLWSTADYLEDSAYGDGGVLEHYLARGVDFAYTLLEYDRETRVLAKLAHTGHAIKLIEQFHQWIDGESPRAFPSGPGEWKPELYQERKERFQFYRTLLRSDEDFRAQVRLELQSSGGDKHEYYLEVLTLLKHDFQTRSQHLFPPEKALMEDVYDRLAKLSGLIITTIPDWFMSSLDLAGIELSHQWRGARVNVQYPPANGESEKAFMAQFGLWKPLNHPHIARLFAACHVGKRFFVRDQADLSYLDQLAPSGVFNWGAVYQCILGLKHLHLCGAAYHEFTQDCIVGASGRTVLEIRGIKQCNDNDGGRSLATSLRSLAQIVSASIKTVRRSRAKKRGLPFVADQGFLTDPEISVLAAMNSLVTNDHVAILRILQQLQTLMPCADTSSEAQQKELTSRLSGVFDELDEYFEDHTKDLDHHVYLRLLNLYEQFCDQHRSSISWKLFDKFSDITERFYRSTVEYCEMTRSRAMAASCAARTTISRNCAFHLEIDRLMAFPDVSSTDSVHTWTGQRNSNGDNTSEGIAETLWAMEELEEGVEQDHEREEAVVVAQFEATRRRGAYSQAAALQRRPSDSGSIRVPEYFIPSYEVELGEVISEGSYGKVYRGKWFETDVAVKTLIAVNSEEQRRAFVREAEIWFMLNHPNVVKLYGACHVGPRPFFVCEWAANGTLPSRMTKIANTNAVSIALHDAAVGLQFLHDQGIVHGDLKGNNILVGSDGKTKLTDFGLSRRLKKDKKDRTKADNTGALGASRWKAPEVLNGSRPTFASDVYGFAMCMIEAVTGGYPWRRFNNDAVVQWYVTDGEEPSDNKEDQLKHVLESSVCKHLSREKRDVILCMISFDPRDRPNIASVVDALADYFD